MFCLSFMGCEDPNLTRIPKAPVNLILNLTTEYPTFRYNTTDTLVFTKPRLGHELTDRLGFGGILVVIGFDKYYAYDLCCPYEADPNIRVHPQENGEAVCKVCGSTFQLLYGYGSVMKGPSKWSLKPYPVVESNTPSGDFLIIQN